MHANRSQSDGILSDSHSYSISARTYYIHVGYRTDERASNSQAIVFEMLLTSEL